MSLMSHYSIYCTIMFYGELYFYSSYILYKQKSQVLQATVMHFNHLILIFVVSRGSTVKLMCQWLHVCIPFSFLLLSDNK